MSSPIQRNTVLSPFPIQTPFFGQPSQGNAPGFKNPGAQTLGTRGPQSASGSPPPLSFAHTKWFQEAGTAINAAPQIQSSVPANSASDGTQGDIAFDGNYLYVCVGDNQWMRAPLSTF